MSSFKQYTGVSDKDVSLMRHCRLQLNAHALVTGAQRGAAVGLIGVPIHAGIHLLFPGHDHRLLVPHVGAGLLLGALIGPALQHFTKERHYTYAECCTRAYVQRARKDTLWTDRLSVAGVVAGGGAAWWLGEGLAKGALVGFAGGSLLGCAIDLSGVLS